MKYFIIGFMGSGKSTVGRKLANRLHFQFFDTDRMVEECFNLPEHEIYSKYGSEIYHKTELEVLTNLCNTDNAVISCGGELPYYYNNIDLINKHGKTIWINMSAKSLANRLFCARKKRVQIQDYIQDIQLLEEFVGLQNLKLKPYFSKAKYEIKGENIQIDELIHLLKIV